MSSSVWQYVLVRRLWQLGFLVAPSLAQALAGSVEALHKALALYRRFHGLTEDASDEAVQASLQAARFCGHPDVLSFHAPRGLPRWNKRPLRWTLEGLLPGVTQEERLACCEQSVAAWAAVCDLEFVYVPQRAGADLVMAVGPIDGGLGTLAWSELPDGSDKPLTQLYDTSERWGVHHGSRPQPLVDLTRVVAHELGHALGIGHLPAGNLMAPTLGAVRTPQAEDVREALARYGPPRTGPGPAPAEIIVTFPEPVTTLKLIRMA